MRGARLVLTVVLTGAAIGTAHAQAPEVSKVEPPSWWVGHSINPIRLLMRGKNLGGAVVEADRGLRVGNPTAGASGTSLFFDVAIDAGAPPGPRRLRIRTRAGSAEASFDVLAPMPREGRFQGLSSDDVIYLLMPDRFANGDPSNDDPPVSSGLMDRGKKRYYHGGDFKGIRDRLPYLADLGVTAVWLNPFYDNSNRLNERERYDGESITDYHGYGAVDFYGVEEHFGSLDDLRRLVDAAHALGLKVVQDQVANHTGPEHPWVEDPPTPAWFNGSRARHVANTWQTWTLVDPHATPEVQKATLEGWFIDILPDLNQDDPEVARYLIQNSLWWVGIGGLDAIRQDTLPYVPRRFWREWTSALVREHPRLNVVGEMWDGDPGLVSFFQGGRERFDGVDSGIQALFDFPLFYPLRRAFAEGKPIREVAASFARDHLYVKPDLLVTFAGLHDVPRFMSEPGATTTGLKLAETLLMTARGIPMIYYGDEIALPGGGDPDNRRDFPGGWPGDARDAFTAAGRTPEEQPVFEHVRKLAHLRAELPALRRGAMVSLLVEEQAWAFARVADEGSAVVVFNNGPEPATLEVPVSAARVAEGSTLEDRLGSAPMVLVKGGKIHVTLPPRSAAVYVVGR